MGTLWTIRSSQPGLSLYSTEPLALGTSYYTISLAVNILLTTLIIARLFMHRRQVLQSLPEEYGRYYVSLASIFVESAALYSVFAIVFLIMYATGSPATHILLAIAGASHVRCYYFVFTYLVDERVWISKLQGI